MRVVQMIDSLDSGGAERMAVTFANELVDKVAFSGLVTTREEGNLKETIDVNVSYLFLNKKSCLDYETGFKYKLILLFKGYPEFGSFRFSLRNHLFQIGNSGCIRRVSA